MRQSLNALQMLGLVLSLAGAAFATTVRIDVVPASDNNATSVTATPGSEVAYQIYIQVISDNTATADNNGLAFFTVDILTDLGVEQPAMDSFSALVNQAFTVVRSLGTPQDDDILQIGGGQNTFAGGTVTAGIGSGEGQLIGQGRLITPSAEGSHTVAIGPSSQANVFAAGSLTSAGQATLQAGPGFTIAVSSVSTTPTIQFDVVPASNNNARSVKVTPGGEVEYEVFAQVISGDTTTTDNNGLASFTVNILTDLGVAQQPMDSFSSVIANAFPTGQSLGTSLNDDIIGIHGEQNTATGGTVTAGIGSERQLIGQGRLTAPTTEASYTVEIGPNSQAKVFTAGSTSSTTDATLDAGSGFTIVVTTSTTPDTVSGDTLTTGALLGGLAFVMIVAAFFLAGPMAAMFALLLLPLLLIAVLMNS